MSQNYFENFQTILKEFDQKMDLHIENKDKCTVIQIFVKLFNNCNSHAMFFKKVSRLHFKSYFYVTQQSVEIQVSLSGILTSKFRYYLTSKSPLDSSFHIGGYGFHHNKNKDILLLELSKTNFIRVSEHVYEKVYNPTSPKLLIQAREFKSFMAFKPSYGKDLYFSTKIYTGGPTHEGSATFYASLVGTYGISILL